MYVGCLCSDAFLPCSRLLDHGAEFSGLALHTGTTLRSTSDGERHSVTVCTHCWLNEYRTIHVHVHTMKPVYCGHPITRLPSIIQPG